MTETNGAGPSLDLSAILERSGPKRKATIDLARLDVSALGVGELLEVAAACDVPIDKLGLALRQGDEVTRARLMLALAWTIARRREPELTLADVNTWQLEVTNSAGPDPTKRAGARRRRAGS